MLFRIHYIESERAHEENLIDLRFYGPVNPSGSCRSVSGRERIAINKNHDQCLRKNLRPSDHQSDVDPTEQPRPAKTKRKRNGNTALERQPANIRYIYKTHMSRGTEFPTTRHVLPAKTPIGLSIRTVSYLPSLHVIWIA